MAFCSKCGAELPEGSRFCQACGQSIGQSEQPREAASQPQGRAEGPDYQRYQQQYQQQQGAYGGPEGSQQSYGGGYRQPPVPPAGVTVGKIYSNSFALFSKKPIRLWGLSLMGSLLMTLACMFGFLPIVWLPIIFVLEAGMASVYLDGYRGKEINSDQLFKGFKSFWRFAGGMGWMYLWVLIWSLIPIVGVVFGIVKSYSYRFVPYILLNDSEISATEALRVSMRLTQGYKGRMFLADLLIYVIVIVIMLIFGALARFGAVLVFLYIVIFLAIAAVKPLILGIFKAAFYDEIEKEKR